METGYWPVIQKTERHDEKRPLGSDCILHKESSKTFIRNIIAESNDNAVTILSQSLKTDAKKAEEKVNATLNSATTNVGKYVQTNLTKNNNLVAMVNAGSKGNPLNLSQIMAIVGQQNLSGKRIPMSFYGRALPHFKMNDHGPAARGFVRSSYYDGLSPTELFFHTVGGREGLVDTAIKSVSGDTPIVITENGAAKRVKIGDWIDDYLKRNEELVEHHKEYDMELLHIDNKNVMIPTLDMKGNVFWAKVTAVTRHDPTARVYKIKTKSGRKVVVAESKSLLIWNNDKGEFEQTETPNVKVGDFVPVTAKLTTNPQDTVSYIEMDKYIYRNEYLYGTDFHEAKRIAEEIENGTMERHYWWKKHNNVSFSLPHKDSRLFLKCLKTTDISNIREGCIYPFYGKRIDTFIPERLELNRENGFFIGIYIAEGDSDADAGSVRVSNNDPEILDLCKRWFEKFCMKWEVSEKANNNLGGTSISIRGFSTVMAKFIIRLVGQGAKNKRIPNEAYNAPDEFIRGLIDGYFSGDGHVGQNSYVASSCSKQLIEGIGFLLTRLGIFSKTWKTQLKQNNVGTENILPTYHLNVRSKWAKKFSEEIVFSHLKKREKSDNISCSETHINYSDVNDVVLDAITKIELVDVKKYPKLYDITVPETLNFCLANCLGMRDTAETG